MATKKPGAKAAPKSKPATKRKAAPKKKATPKSSARTEADDDYGLEGTALGSFIDGMTDITASAIRMAMKTREVATDAIEQATETRQRVNRSINRSPEQLRRMADAGESLRDMREVAGMTLADLSKALMIRDKS